jgi:hypothetical protein
MWKPVACGLLLALAGGYAWAQPDDLAHDQASKAKAEAAHAQAVKSGDQAAIAKTNAQIREADSLIYEDRREASVKVPPGETGALRDVDTQLLHAKEDAERAYATGDEAAIAASKKRVHELYERRWAILHGKS